LPIIIADERANTSWMMIRAGWAGVWSHFLRNTCIAIKSAPNQTHSLVKIVFNEWLLEGRAQNQDLGVKRGIRGWNGMLLLR